jgi:ATP-dependent RNA helicase DBP3
MDEAARLKAEKKARKEEKRQKKAAAAAAATSVEESTLEPTAATEPEVAADEALKAKKEKKEKKKRKREAEAAANGNSAEDAAAVAENINADEEPVAEEKIKKKRKKNVKGAFGNDPSKAPNGHAASAPAPATNGSSKISSIPSIPQSEIDQFQSSNNVSYDPPSAPSEYAPILAFDQLPVAQGIKDGLKSFSKPTTVQSASWGVQLRTSKTARARDCVSIAATG